MRLLAAVGMSALLAIAPAAPGWCSSEPRPVLGANGKPLEITAQVPSMSALGLSYVVPGGTQFYLGDSTRGWVYVGSAVGTGLALAGLQKVLFDFYPTPEQIAFSVVQGLVLGWVGIGTVSAVDGYLAIQARRPAVSTPEAR